MGSRDGGALRILVIEDNQHFRLLLRTVLQALGPCEIIEATDGTQAWSLLTAAAADLLIVDWRMEPMDGLAFAHKVRRSPDSPCPDVPIIMVTGYSEVRLAQEARDAGVNEFVTKPISAKTLIGCITEVLGHPRPFVRTSAYFGPDRRRRQDAIDWPERRQP